MIHQQHFPNVYKVIFGKEHSMKFCLVYSNTSQLRFLIHRNWLNNDKITGISKESESPDQLKNIQYWPKSAVSEVKEVISTS